MFHFLTFVERSPDINLRFSFYNAYSTHPYAFVNLFVRSANLTKKISTSNCFSDGPLHRTLSDEKLRNTWSEFCATPFDEGIARVVAYALGK